MVGVVKMKTIWKFPLKITNEQLINVPAGSKLLTVQMQGDVPCLWALVDPNTETSLCTIQTFGTGHPAENAGTYLSTYQVDSLVFHVFFVGGSA